MAKDFGVSGFDVLDRKLAAIERGPSRREVVGVLRKGANVIAREERALAPVKTGRTRRSITVTTSPGFDVPEIGRSDITVFVGPRSSAWRAYLIEFGTSRSAAHPFIRPALDNRGDEAIGVVISGLRDLYGDMIR